MSRDHQKELLHHLSSIGEARPPELIDRLVCGELRGDAYRHAVQWLDGNPQRWRDCALAFLQEQAMEQDLRQIAAQSVDWCSMKQSPQPELAKTIRTIPNKEEQGTVQVESSSYWNQVSRRAVKLTGLAALLLIGFGGGWIASQSAEYPWGSESSTFTGREPDPDSHSKLQHLAMDRGGGPQAEFTRNVDARDHVSQPSWAIPEAFFRNNSALPGNLSSRLLSIDQKIPEELLELQRQGRIRIESSSSLMPIQQKNGASVLVPVQQYKIEPVVFSY